MNKNIRKMVFDLKTSTFRRKSTRYYEYLEKNQSLSLDEINYINWSKRLDIIKYAYRKVPFYRRAYSEKGLSYDKIQKQEDFCLLPIVSKEDLRNSFDALIAENISSVHCNKSSTGGSTGVPVTVLHDRRLFLEAAAWRMLRWWDIEPSDDMAFVYRLVRKFPKNYLNAAMWWPTRRIFLDASNMNKGTITEFVQKYTRLRPTMLQGYVGGIYELALYLQEKKWEIPPPKAVWVTSAPVSEGQRSLMQKVFNAPVYDQYGSCEVMWLAAECKEQNGLHINSDIRYLEFVDDYGMPVPDGEWGRILVTDLENRVFPLIRYDIGDMGRRLIKKCSCGINLPMMDKVRGRVSDVIQLPNGKKISGEYLTTIFDDHPDAVNAFQIYQRKDYSIILRCVKGRDKGAENIINQVISSLRIRSDRTVPITLEMLSNIPHNRGKTQFIIRE